MLSFIDQVINEITTGGSENLRRTCVIFPTRRACLIFRKRLAASKSKPVWAPGIMGIGDFVSKHAPIPVTDEIPLLLSLFEVYHKYWPEHDFGKFYAWGQMMLNDFDEIDKQLPDPSKIFTHISELKKIDAAFLPDASSLSWIREFIASMNEENMSEIQKRFASTWNQLKQIYTQYNQLLNTKQFCYEGKAYRELLGKLKKGTFESQWENFVFAGFYGFSAVEEELIKLLRNKYKVSICWDADEYYINNKSHEAGYYFRKSKLFSEFPNWTGNHFTNTSKSIEITGVPFQAGQAKYVGQLLSTLHEEGRLDINSTAIILPDENMLFPVLYALPEFIEPINVTMGYPLRQSQYIELLKVLHDLHKHAQVDKNGDPLFFHRNLKRLFRHPLFRNKITRSAEEDDAGHGNYLGVAEIISLYQPGSAIAVFKQVTSPGEVLQYLIEILDWLSQDLKKEKYHSEDRIIDFIAGELKLLYEYSSDHLHSISTETMWQMARECVSGLKVPFSGEPVSGLQVMGFLETRALDFKTIIVLNANEGILPSTTANRSFIPFALRKAYGLATYEDQDASFSYHFYRLLHKSEHVYLLYNSEVDKTNGGEPSRFLLQIKQELKKYMGDSLTITTKFINTPINPSPVKPITINKNNQLIRDQLDRYIAGNEEKPVKSFSSSALTTYISCSLKFYFRYIAGMKEQMEEEESIEDHTFGRILHRAVELLYKDENEMIDSGTIEKLLAGVDDAVEQAVKEIYKISVPHLTGNDILLTEVIRELVKRILKNDQLDVPFRIIGVEKEISGIFKSGNIRAGIRGNIDRIDIKDGIARIIDYKTGKVDLKIKSPEELVHDPARKSLFQLYFYSLLFRLAYPDQPVKTGFYLVRSLGSGIAWSQQGSVISDEQLEMFKKLLEQKITEIMDPEKEFLQTEDKKQCLYCEYKLICSR